MMHDRFVWQPGDVVKLPNDKQGKLFDESEHPRDDRGRFTDAGGGGDHPGEGYSSNAYVKDGVIHTTSVEDAALALHQDRAVELDQPRGLSVLIDRLGEITRQMIAKGEKAPKFNLCKVTVKNTNLFCVDTHGIPRVEMPQIAEGDEPKFEQFLIDKGYAVKAERQQAAYLRATQIELSGEKVAAIANAMRATPDREWLPIFVSDDDYILDGHHRWGAKIGIDAEDNVLGNHTRMDIRRVNISITKLLQAAEEFTGGHGKVEMAYELAELAKQFVTKDSEHTDWMNECVPTLMGYGKDQEVAVAACLNMWRDAWEQSHPDGAVDPGPAKPEKSMTIEQQRAALRRHRFAQLRQKWDESQHPRDPAGTSTGGQFTSSGGGGEGTPSSSPHAKDPTSASALLRIESISVDQLYDKVPGSREQDAAARAKLKEVVSTDRAVSEGGYKLPNGAWAPDRLPVHRAIVEKLMPQSAVAAAQPAPGEPPTLYIMGGRGGSGKSWFTDKKRGGTIDTSKAVYINNDDVKEALPEYRGWNAGVLHEEASAVAEQMEDYARDNRLNIIVDATLKSEGSLAKRVKAYKAAGYKISGHYMYASPATAAERALGRFVGGNKRNGKGRFVPPEYSLNSLSNEASFDAHRAEMDYWEIYDNNGEGAPKLHAKKG